MNMMNVVSSSSSNHPQKLQISSCLVQLRVSTPNSPRPRCKINVHYSCPASSSSVRLRRVAVVFRRVVAARAVGDGGDQLSSGGGKDGEEEEENASSKKEEEEDDDEASRRRRSREELERLIGRQDDARFSGLDLANLIRKKYGRSYDVTLIKKEFMGRSLLAMNVMWKYREQRSFPLTEEEYLVRLDEVANTLKCWGAVAHVRNSLEKLKERPRIGKAVSIFIDMDQTGARADEWIYK